MALRALSPRDCQREFFFCFYLHIDQQFSQPYIIIEWVQEIENAGKKARNAEQKVARKLRR